MDVRTAIALYSRLCALADGVDRHVRDLPSTPQRAALEALGQELDAVIDGFVRLELAQPQPPRRSTTEERPCSREGRAPMPLITHWTSPDLDTLTQQEGVRYEIIDGDLYVSTAPSFQHQYALDALITALRPWSLATGLGLAMSTPGLIFAPDQDVQPDLLWMSHQRLQGALDPAGHFTRAPELVVEVLSPGRANVHRDREAKLALYSRQGVDEYWIVDPLAQTLDVYRQQDGALVPLVTLTRQDTLTSPLLPGFTCVVGTLFAGEGHP